MPFEERIVLRGTESIHRSGLEAAGPVKGDETVTVSVILRHAGGSRRSADGANSTEASEPSAIALGANPSDISIVEEFAHHSDLTVVESDTRKRRVILTGTAEEMQNAFRAELVTYRESATGQQYRGCKTALSVPTELESIVTAILGLDARPLAKPHFIPWQAAGGTSYTPPQVAAMYNFPTVG